MGSSGSDAARRRERRTASATWSSRSRRSTARATDAFYYGGERPCREVSAPLGPQIVGTAQPPTAHRRRGAGSTGGASTSFEPGDCVATQYGDDMWSSDAGAVRRLRRRRAPHGSQKRITVPGAMTEHLAFFLGAFAAEGHIARSNHTIRIANADEGVIARLVADAEVALRLHAARVARARQVPVGRPVLQALVEFLDYLGCGDARKRQAHPGRGAAVAPQPWFSPSSKGCAWTRTYDLGHGEVGDLPRLRGLLDDLQAVLTNLGVVHSRISKYNATYHKSFDEVYCCGREAQRLVGDDRVRRRPQAARAPTRSPLARSRRAARTSSRASPAASLRPHPDGTERSRRRGTSVRPPPSPSR